MPLDFPNSPSTNDTFTSGGITWKYDGEKWRLVSSLVSPVAYSDLAPQTINIKSDSYTLLTADAGKLIAMNKSTAQTVTVNGSLDLEIGQKIDILQTGAGQVTVSGSGATVNGTPGLKFREQYSAATLLCTATDTYVLIGDLST